MRNKTVLPALLLILIGLWLLAGNLGIRLPQLLDWGQIWPIFIVLGGLSGLWSYFSRRNRDPDQLFWGFAALGVGCFFFLFTLRLLMPILGRFVLDRMDEFWLGFVLIAAGSFLAQYLLSGLRRRDALMSGVLAFVAGIVAFAFTLGFLGLATMRSLLNLWPIILIGIGLGMIGRAVVRRR